MPPTPFNLRGRGNFKPITPPPPPSVTAIKSRDNNKGRNTHTRPPGLTNEQIIEAGKYGRKGAGILTPSPLGAQSDRWTRLPVTNTRPATVNTPTTSGGGYDYSGGYAPQDGGGGGGGGPAEPVKVGWKETYTAAGAPSWWKGLTPDALDPVSEYTLLYNAMIPYMSPEDQRQAGSTLAALYPDEALFQGYSMERTPKASPGGNFDQAPAPQYDYLSSQRAQNMLSTLDRVRQVMGKAPTDYGPGYQFLRNTAAVLKDYGGNQAARQSRAQYLSQIGALDPLLAQAKSDQLAAYGPMLQQLTQPFFSGGSLRDVAKDETGRYIFGRANKALY